MVFIQFTIRSIKELKVSVRFKSQNKSDDRKFKFPILFFFARNRLALIYFAQTFVLLRSTTKKAEALNSEPRISDFRILLL